MFRWGKRTQRSNDQYSAERRWSVNPKIWMSSSIRGCSDVCFGGVEDKEIDIGSDERFALRASSASGPKGETFVWTNVYFLVLNIVLSKSTRCRGTFSGLAFMSFDSNKGCMKAVQTTDTEELDLSNKTRLTCDHTFPKNASPKTPKVRPVGLRLAFSKWKKKKKKTIQHLSRAKPFEKQKLWNWNKSFF